MTVNPPFIIDDFNFRQLDRVWIIRYSAVQADPGSAGYFQLLPEQIEIGYASFLIHDQSSMPVSISLRINTKQLIISCSCPGHKNLLCVHQSRVLMNVLEQNYLRIFFDWETRIKKLQHIATGYGLENEKDLEAYFRIKLDGKELQISPVLEYLLPVTAERNSQLKALLVPANGRNLPKHLLSAPHKKNILVFRQHKYYSHFQAELMAAAFTMQDKPKNPLESISAIDFIWTAEAPAEVKFYTALSRFQQRYDQPDFALELNSLKALFLNPAKLKVYLHDPKVSENMTAATLVPVNLQKDKMEIELQVDLKDSFYTISASINIAHKRFDLLMLPVTLNYFILHHKNLYLIDQPELLNLIHFFKKHHNHILIHESRYESFYQDVLAGLEQRIQINYTYIKKATVKQLKSEQTSQDRTQSDRELLIYLTDSENYVLLNPVIRYNDTEIPVLSRKQILTQDRNGKVFRINRDEEAELRFLTLISRQHLHFEDQLQQDAFYLHKKHFLDETWFLETFRIWQENGITILGFQDLKGNKLNPNQAKIDIEIISGLDWFDTKLELSYGNQRVPLKQLHRAIRNKSKFVILGDGTHGLLPQQWLARLNELFQLSTLNDEKLSLPKTSFTSIPEWFDANMLSDQVKMELTEMNRQLADFNKIESIGTPSGLNAVLRSYQQQGLNWLNFLGTFNFGGILADDMGLGKTLQVIAYILSSRAKTKGHPSLVVVPATLIFNWQAEIKRFAPELATYTLYGTDRAKDTDRFQHADIVLTSYGTLLRDIGWLKNSVFEHIFLDESQQIKNPESLIYKAVILLKGRNRICMTGTPIENNTYDLYGQLSFACPGLLGSKQHFREQYASPVDQFNDTKKAAELRKKISPFILRRTKKEVATELPEKTEMVIYCEMDESQWKAYDACKNEYKDYLNHVKSNDLAGHTIHILKGLTQLRQICNSPALLKDNLLHGNSSAKINVLMEEIQNHSPQHKILVFSQFVGMLDLIRKELKSKNINHEYLTGQSANRQKSVSNFQENDDVRVFLISLKAGGTGLNLTKADYVYLVDPWWNPAVENQAIDRSYRIGQEKHVVAVRLICPDTIEEKIMLLQQRKKNLFSDIIHTDSSLFNTMTKKDLLELLK